MATLLISRFWTNLFKGNGFGSWICILMSWTLVLIIWVAGCQNQWSFLLDPPLIWVKQLSGAFATMVIQCDQTVFEWQFLFWHNSSGVWWKNAQADRSVSLQECYKWHHSPLLPLAISNNYLSGSEDFQSFGMVYLTSIYALDMNNNNLSGELPSAVDSLTKLETFSTEI